MGIADIIGYLQGTVEKQIAKMTEEGIIARVGGDSERYWKIKCSMTKLQVRRKNDKKCVLL